MVEHRNADWSPDFAARLGAALARVQALPPRTEPVALSAAEVAAMIDHTALKADVTPEMIETLCAEAREYRFASVCVNSAYVPDCVRALTGTGIPVCSVVGFPLGANLPAAKACEARMAIEEGAREIDMVIQIGALKAREDGRVKDDLAAVVAVCHERGAILKVIIEAALLSQEEKVAACLLIAEAGADYCKTSTGFGPGGATVADVALMRATVGLALGVKAAGGIRSYEDAMAMVGAGASRIGASAGVKIFQAAPR